ncbi:MAG TPA: DUF4139 domain-containing protein [Rhizomicrobium sp.]|nr:DUF4139 domain-containing protein [Rhizomicrobium sp.]
MRRYRIGAAALLACAVAAPAFGAGELSLTVYNNDLMLVRDQRVLDLPLGRGRVELEGIAASIRPETVSLSGDGFSVVEQNFDYDLLTPAKMMEKAVGQKVHVVRTNPGSGAEKQETATVLSANSGVILKIGNRIEVLRDDGVPERVVFDSIPENLRASPTLSATLDASQAGARPLVLSYLAKGMSWSANYVGMLDDKDGTLALQGWITLVNKSGTNFKDAHVELVAGAINTTDGGQDYHQNQTSAAAGGAGAATRAKQLADYYAYHMPERVTVANEQTKQVAFLSLDLAHVNKSYEYTADDLAGLRFADHADVMLHFDNGGEPLPEGALRVYMRDETGAAKFVGENEIDHTPAGSALSIKLGQAFDVTVLPTRLSSEKTRNGWRNAMRYTLHNARNVPVTVELRQTKLGHDAKLVSESAASRRIDADTLVWSIAVPAGGESTLDFTVEGG